MLFSITQDATDFQPVVNLHLFFEFLNFSMLKEKKFGYKYICSFKHSFIHVFSNIVASKLNCC